jgi:uncharacterized protein (DUF433 family)
MSVEVYVEERDGRVYLRGSRVPLTALAALWSEGASPEAMVEHYPTLTLSQVFGGLAFYLEHREEIDRHRREDQTQFAAARAAQRATEPERYAELQRRFEAARAREHVSPR